MPADVVQLDAFRARRAKPTPKPVAPAHLYAERGLVVLAFSNQQEVILSAEHARVWAERIAAMADVAHEQEREGKDRG